MKIQAFDNPIEKCKPMKTEIATSKMTKPPKIKQPDSKIEVQTEIIVLPE